MDYEPKVQYTQEGVVITITPEEYDYIIKIKNPLGEEEAKRESLIYLGFEDSELERLMMKSIKLNFSRRQKPPVVVPLKNCFSGKEEAMAEEIKVIAQGEFKSVGKIVTEAGVITLQIEIGPFHSEEYAAAVGLMIREKINEGMDELGAIDKRES